MASARWNTVAAQRRRYPSLKKEKSDAAGKETGATD
jgi:hypothetical protein